MQKISSSCITESQRSAQMSIHDGVLSVKELNVVNGCQSLSTIFSSSEAAKKATDAYILFRFYEIEDQDRADRISTSTNSQSAVKSQRIYAVMTRPSWR